MTDETLRGKAHRARQALTEVHEKVRRESDLAVLLEIYAGFPRTIEILSRYWGEAPSEMVNAIVSPRITGTAYLAGEIGLGDVVRHLEKVLGIQSYALAA